jgi:hypothetical protein
MPPEDKSYLQNLFADSVLDPYNIIFTLLMCGALYVLKDDRDIKTRILKVAAVAFILKYILQVILSIVFA